MGCAPWLLSPGDRRLDAPGDHPKRGLNGNAIWGTTNSIGSSLGNGTSILPGRIPRIAFQMQF
jgi:hypothetical protein